MTSEQPVQPFREKILIVDDDSHIREVVRFALNKAGYRTCEAADGEQCLKSVASEQPDLIILDVLMPEMDGTEVCRKLRETSDIPLIFLSSRDDEIDRVIGLELGGDDYVTKPFSPRELVARVKALLRRMKPSNGSSAEQEPDQQRHGHLLLVRDRFQVFWKEREVVLTATEFSLLQALLNRPGRVYSRDELMERGYEGIVSDRTIDSHIRRLRSKFNEVGGDPIVTVRGVGYKLGPCL